MVNAERVVNDIAITEIATELYNQIKYGDVDDGFLRDLVSTLSGKELKRLVHNLELDHIELPYELQETSTS